MLIIIAYLLRKFNNIILFNRLKNIKVAETNTIFIKTIINEFKNYYKRLYICVVIIVVIIYSIAYK